MSPLEPWMIEKIKREKERKRRESEIQPELPVSEPLEPQEVEEEKEKRGPVVIDISGNLDEDDETESNSSRGVHVYTLDLI